MNFIRGLTFETTFNIDTTRSVIMHLPFRPTIRLVWQPDESYGEFLSRCTSLQDVADILACICDSSLIKDLHPVIYRGRADMLTSSKLLMRDKVIVETLNEGGGNWLGPDAEVYRKALSAEAVCKKAGFRTAATFIVEGERPNHWLPFAARAHLQPDYALFSWYPMWTPEVQIEWPEHFQALNRLFPKAGLGFGEFGPEPRRLAVDKRIELIRQIHGIRDVGQPNFIGGYFYWDTATEAPSVLAALSETLK